jgi:tetratricopeptide (TPR) repeat protein
MPLAAPDIDAPQSLLDAQALGRAGWTAEALSIARRFTESGAEPDLRLSALLDCAEYHWKLGDAPEGLAAAIAARNHAGSLHNEDAEAAALALAALHLLDLDRSDEALADAAAAVSLAEDAGAPMTLAYALDSKGAVLLAMEHPRAAEQYFRWAVKVAAESGDDGAFGLFLGNLAAAFARLTHASRAAGRGDEANSHIDLAIDIGAEAITAARRAGDGWCLRRTLVDTASYLNAGGLPDLTRALLEQWIDTPGEPGPREIAHCEQVRAMLAAGPDSTRLHQDMMG